MCGERYLILFGVPMDLPKRLVFIDDEQLCEILDVAIPKEQRADEPIVAINFMKDGVVREACTYHINDGNHDHIVGGHRYSWRHDVYMRQRAGIELSLMAESERPIIEFGGRK